MQGREFGPSSLSVAAVQMNSGADKVANVETALRLIDRAAAGGARLIALPEVWTYLGPEEGERENAEPIPGPTTDRLAERARRHGVWIHAGSIVETRAGDPRLRNTTAVLAPSGEVVARYTKIHLYDVVLDGVATYQESATISPGDEIVTVDVEGVTVGLTICYDLRFPELFRILALRGAEVIVLPAAFTLATGKDHWEVLIRARAIENGVFMVAPAQVGKHGDKWCYGRSMIVDPWGTVLATAPDTETAIGCDLDLDRLRSVRRQVPSLANRIPERYAWPEVAATGVR
ncbi:MAG: Aliphatic amidase AmiE [uncultured Thermomicrobiales bacterium]|uniref:Aliphatic amidase AmiE n=1 Tax=uncultured Thermomicrobiales bacterium TaxID=1645740 RepID=A0A6J4V1D7_9BACT|nr:MAG: Aliphatic amidase AmiE [uncultured Thermomicrobiales bacterium]